MKGNQRSNNSSVSTSATSTQIANAMSGNLRRVQIMLINTSAAAVITITKGNVAAVAGSGIRLIPNAAYYESDDSGYKCWQQEFQAVSDVAGTLAVVETFEELY